MKRIVLDSPNSPYWRKPRIVFGEKGIAFEFQANGPWTSDSLAATYYPLAKISILIIEDASTLNASRSIGSGLCCGMAMSHVPAGESPAQITASHGSGIEPCRFAGNGELDA